MSIGTLTQDILDTQVSNLHDRAACSHHRGAPDHPGVPTAADDHHHRGAERSPRPRRYPRSRRHHQRTHQPRRRPVVGLRMVRHQQDHQHRTAGPVLYIPEEQ